MEKYSKYETNEGAESAGAAARALDILELLEASDDPLTLSQIAEALGLPKASAHRLLGTLRGRGYIEQARPRSGYTLGPRVLRLAARARERFDLSRVADPYLRELARVTGESCQLSLLSGRQALCVARVSSPAHPDLSLAGQVGSVFPLHASAVGKVLLAFAPSAEQGAYLAGELGAYTERTFVEGAALATELQSIRANGLAHDAEEYKRGLSALAAPVFEADGRVRSAVGLPFLTSASGGEDGKAVALRAASSGISRALGWAG